MKKIYNLILLLMVAAACQPDEFPAIGKKNPVIPQLIGTWSIVSVKQTDNDAQRKGFPLFAQTQDLTQYFPYQDFNITLNTNESGSPGTFSVTLGNSPNILGGITSGLWNVDNENFPSALTFSENDLQSTVEIGSLAEIGAGKLELKVIRYQDTSKGPQPVITYDYLLSKTN
ncbi:MAG TPA: DUF5004 domain-containing protein [Ohtaekwangia sp.]|nr:DUF5004 domain-containing protein [Ohtaekwangia sp.]